MSSLGQELKRERELRGISLKEIQVTTKISMKFLAALEEDRLDILPGEFFIKGSLRLYARCLGLDEDAVLNKYCETRLLQAEKNPDTEEKKEHKKGFKIKFSRNYLIVFVMLVFASLSVYFISSAKRNPPKKSVSQAAAHQENIPPSPPLLPDRQNMESPQEEVQNLHLKIHFLEETWIQLSIDGKVSLQGLKRPGETHEVPESREIVLNLGNAGGIQYSLNGRKTKPLGSSGQVVKNVKINLDNFRQFLENETKSQS